MDEDYFPSFLLQAGACHQQIYPAFDSLSSWRLRMVLDDQFQMFWDDLRPQSMCDYDEYCQWLGFGEGQFVAYDGEQEVQPEKPAQTREK